MDTPEKPVSEAEAAEYLGISLETLRKHRRAGYGPPHSKLGRRPVYILSLVHEWLLRGGSEQRPRAVNDQEDWTRTWKQKRLDLEAGRNSLLQDHRRKGHKVKPGRRTARDGRASPHARMGLGSTESGKHFN